MPSPIVDYLFSALTVANPDGTLPATVTDGTLTAGPGPLLSTTYPNAVDLGTTGGLVVDLSALAVPQVQFAVRVVLRTNGTPGERQSVVAAERPPFSLDIVPRPGSTTSDMTGWARPMAHGWRPVSTRFDAGILPDSWHVLDLLYDVDTVAVAIDGAVVSVQAFPLGALHAGADSRLYVGAAPDGSRHFDGSIAAITITDGIPWDLLAQLDEFRQRPQWFISRKVEELRSTRPVGEPLGPITMDAPSASSMQRYEHGTLFVHESMGSAFELHGTMLSAYLALPQRGDLGRLVSDEMPTTGAGGRKSLFSSGGLYWSEHTGVVPVFGRVFTAYEYLGESARHGFPLSAATSVAGGLVQVFQGAHFMARTPLDPAYEVHGDILAKYLSLGGPAAFGFPSVNELPVVRDGTTIGARSSFDGGGGTIYWSASTGAFEVHGDLDRAYSSRGGPAGDLGFPVTDETEIPGGAGRYNRFERGSLFWYGTAASILRPVPFHIFLARIDAEESEGVLMGENDMYIRLRLLEGETVLYDQRRPSGDWEDSNIVDVNLEVPVLLDPDPSRSFTFSVEVKESDPGPDDDLGTWTTTLDAANGWGMRENGGLLESGSFSMINSITASVKPVVDVAALKPEDTFWGATNTGTDDLTWRQYASAFTGIDSEPELHDPGDWLDRIFFELAVQDIAEDGNCFGMCLEAIRARKSSSVFGYPLKRFTNWETIRPEINVKQAYQVGMPSIGWFLAMFASGNSHNPVDVFRYSRASFEAGNDPILCVAGNYDFSGAPHSLLPVRWADDSKPWRIWLFDPNTPQIQRVLTVDPDENSFKYSGSSRVYEGTRWGGGRFYFVPFSVVSSPSPTPVSDLVQLVLDGTIVAMGDANETGSITDTEGRDLDGTGPAATAQLQGGQQATGYFLPVPRLQRRSRHGSGAAGATVLARAGGPRTRSPLDRDSMHGLEQPQGDLGHESLDPLSAPELRALLDRQGMERFREAIGDPSSADPAVIDRALLRLANEASAAGSIGQEAHAAVVEWARRRLQGDFRHVVRSTTRGRFDYLVKHGLGEIRVTTRAGSGETMGIEVTRLGRSTNMVRVAVQNDKSVDIDVSHRVGLGGDRVAIRLEGLRVLASSPLRLNLKPGIGGLELTTAAPPGSVSMTVTGSISGSPLDRRYSVPIHGGGRINPAALASQDELRVSRISSLFGPVQDVAWIAPS
jgi:LGFP repeat